MTDTPRDPTDVSPPRPVVRAINLLYLEMLAWLLVILRGFIRVVPLVAPFGATVLLVPGLDLILLALLARFTVSIASGRNWARFALLAYAAVLFSLQAPVMFAFAQWDTGPLPRVLALVQILAHAAALALLFLPPSSAWFHASRGARATWWPRPLLLVASALPALRRGPDLPLNWRLGLWCLAFGSALIATGATLVLYTRSVTLPLQLIPLFPAGLAAIYGGRVNTDDTRLLAVGWMLYAGLTLTLMLSRKKRLYLAVFAVLCGMLVSNVVGCYHS
jgi:hypothetical protein